MSTPPPPPAAAPLSPIPGTSPSTPLHPPVPGVKLDIPSTQSPSPSLDRPPITIPRYSAWFSFDAISTAERRALPEFFDGASPSRNPAAYKYYRDAIVRQFRESPARRLSFTEARRRLAGDAGSIRLVFDFLEAWGLINYAPPPTPAASVTKPAVKDREEGVDRKELTKRVCCNCKSVCSLGCFANDKADIILCTKCYVRCNYRPGLSSTDFKRIGISEESKAEWTDKETLHLLEAVLQYGDDWRKVAEHVGSRSEKECVARFIKLPFGEQFLRPEEDREGSSKYQRNDQVSAENGGKSIEEPCLSKRRRLTPLADASNPIMAQVAFLSAMAGSEVVEAASQAAITALHEVDLASITAITANDGQGKGEDFTENGQNDAKFIKEVVAEAQSQHEKEQQDVEQSISDIVDVQMKEIQEKIVHFEGVELQLEKERLQLSYMKDLLFADQLNILQHRDRIKSSRLGDGDKMRTTDNITSFTNRI